MWGRGSKQRKAAVARRKMVRPLEEQAARRNIQSPLNLNYAELELRVLAQVAKGQESDLPLVPTVQGQSLTGRIRQLHRIPLHNIPVPRGK